MAFGVVVLAAGGSGRMGRAKQLLPYLGHTLVEHAARTALASGAAEGSDVPEWARVTAPTYLNLRKASIYGGSNEIQRQIISRTILGL